MEWTKNTWTYCIDAILSDELIVTADGLFGRLKVRVKMSHWSVCGWTDRQGTGRIAMSHILKKELVQDSSFIE
jgi:hypothetical protein